MGCIYNNIDSAAKADYEQNFAPPKLEIHRMAFQKHYYLHSRSFFEPPKQIIFQKLMEKVVHTSRPNAPLRHSKMCPKKLAGSPTKQLIFFPKTNISVSTRYLGAISVKKNLQNYSGVDCKHCHFTQYSLFMMLLEKIQSDWQKKNCKIFMCDVFANEWRKKIRAI